MGADIFRKFVNGVKKVQKLFGNGDFEFTDEQWRKLYSAFAKMSLWEGVDERKVKEARKEGYSVVNGKKSKVTEFSDDLKEYKLYMENFGLLPGVSKKLAKDGTLDDISNKMLKAYYGIQKREPLNLIAITNYIHNKSIDLSSYKNGYINDQNTGVVSKLRFGATTMNNNGCEIIAAYNAMKVLGNQKDIRDIAYYFENDGQMLGGYFGTNPYANKRFFEKEGYKVKVVEGEKIMEDKLPKADAYVLSFWNSDDVTDALHTVAMRRTRDGKYELFNNNPITERSDVVRNLSKVFLGDGSVPLSVHCISK